MTYHQIVWAVDIPVLALARLVEEPRPPRRRMIAWRAVVRIRAGTGFRSLLTWMVHARAMRILFFPFSVVAVASTSPTWYGSRISATVSVDITPNSDLQATTIRGSGNP